VHAIGPQEDEFADGAVVNRRIASWRELVVATGQSPPWGFAVGDLTGAQNPTDSGASTANDFSMSMDALLDRVLEMDRAETGVQNTNPLVGNRRLRKASKPTNRRSGGTWMRSGNCLVSAS
jgi:hypothetical protein